MAGGRTPTGRDAVEWAREGVARGAGEILLTSMDRDGTGDGYELELTRADRSEAVDVPVIASGRRRRAAPPRRGLRGGRRRRRCAPRSSTTALPHRRGQGRAGGGGLPGPALMLERPAARPRAPRSCSPRWRDEPGVYVVGGAVRDALLGRVPRELDLVVEGDAVAVARRAAARVGGTLTVHERFGTATVLARGLRVRPRGRSHGDLRAARRAARRGAGRDASREDLARRDFTINAMAVGLADGAVIEWPGARADLDARRAARPARALVRRRPDADAAAAALRRAAGVRSRTRRPTALIDPERLDTVSGDRLGNELRLLLRRAAEASGASSPDSGSGAALLGEGFHVPPVLPARAAGRARRLLHRGRATCARGWTSSASRRTTASSSPRRRRRRSRCGRRWPARPTREHLARAAPAAARDRRGRRRGGRAGRAPLARRRPPPPPGHHRRRPRRRRAERRRRRRRARARDGRDARRPRARPRGAARGCAGAPMIGSFGFALTTNAFECISPSGP